jgi:hypothetical protein
LIQSRGRQDDNTYCPNFHDIPLTERPQFSFSKDVVLDLLLRELQLVDFEHDVTSKKWDLAGRVDLNREKTTQIGGSILHCIA